MLFILKLSKKAFSIKWKMNKNQEIEERGPKMTKKLKIWHFFTQLLINAYILQLKTLKM